MNNQEEKVCERFAEVRSSLKMKQGEFAKEIKLTQGHVSDIENKRKCVSDRVIEIISLKFNINKNWLQTGKGNMKKEVDEEFGAICADIGVHDEKAKEAIMKYHELTEEDKKLWWEWLERFAKF